MIKELDELREIGAKKISEDTHIPLSFVQSIIHESFEGLTKIQFVGFISILQREYDIDLSILKAKGLDYINGVQVEESIDTPVFVTGKEPAKFRGLYITIGLIIFAFVVYAGFYTNVEKVISSKINDSAIDDAKKNIDKEEIEKNLAIEVKTDAVMDKNQSVVKIENIDKDIKKDVKTDVKTDFAPLVIYPKSKLWIGYINQISGKKYQKVITKKLVIDPDTIWLLSLGHGYIKIEANSKKFDYSSPGNTRFLYKNGVLKHISVKEFKALNKGRLW